ncbi:hypothetical protein FH972_022962 [Carpinus fangiana]|uniref:Uncharacterized protein n=1 Tax=Carpinus fangiana TaxID=176857 RepID=A0A5N6KU94_9ROSI|nr:hypothetical protein FH972_022962 [Carpinus fangiana]
MKVLIRDRGIGTNNPPCHFLRIMVGAELSRTSAAPFGRLPSPCQCASEGSHLSRRRQYLQKLLLLLHHSATPAATRRQACAAGILLYTEAPTELPPLM